MGGSKKAKKNKANKASESSNPARDGDGRAGSEIITDSRFASVHSDPRFQKVPKHKAKVEIDSRFDRVLTDKRFVSSAAPVDKRGKPKKQNSENFLRHYYRIEESKAKEKEEETDEEEEEEEEEEVEEERKSEKLVKCDGEESETESSDESETDESEEEEAGSLEVDTDEDEDDLVHVELDDGPELPEEHIPEIEKETHRLAVVNMDWRYVKAVDLYMMLSSFLSQSGQIMSVAVYPSEFGLQRMKEEEVNGPVGLFDDESEENSNDGDGNNNENDDDEIDNEKLRAYEMSRLRYYFAVVECDSIATADYLYKTCDGVEFERSSNVLDLRFIPDSMEFKHPPRDVATEAPANYEALNFQTRALQQSKIRLTWDEDEPERVKTLKRKFNADQLEELELKEFLASDESESESESNESDDNATEDQLDKKQKKRDIYRALLESGNASDGDDEDEGQDMEVTFNTGLEDLSKRILEKKDKKQETVWEAKLREQRERKKLRKNRSKHSSEDESSDTDQEAVEEPGDFFVDEEEPSVQKRNRSNGKTAKREKQQEDTNGQAEATREELELLLADDTIGDKSVKGYNLKPKKVRGKDGKKVKEILEEDKIPPVADDPRFASLFTSPEFAMDPTDPQFKRSATYARQVALRKQKDLKEFSKKESLASPEPQAANTDERVKSDAQSSKREKYKLSTLLKSVKMKCKQVKLPSNGNASKKDGGSSKSTGVEEKKRSNTKDDISTLVESLKRKTKKFKTENNIELKKRI